MVSDRTVQTAWPHVRSTARPSDLPGATPSKPHELIHTNSSKLDNRTNKHTHVTRTSNIYEPFSRSNKPMTSSRIQAIILSSAVLLTPSFAPVFAQTNSSTTGSGGNSTAGDTGMNRSGMSGMTGSAKDKKFLMTAAQGGLAEIQLGQLATQKSNNQQVKDFGQKMITDHTQLNDQMKPIAQSMGVPVPTSPSPKDQAEATKLSALSGESFDKAYIAYMVKDHQKDVREFKAEEASTQDPTLKTTVAQGLTVIEGHLQMAETLAKTNGVKGGQSNHSTSPSGQ